MGAFFEADGSHLRCPGCDRVIDAAHLRPGERFKCAKCKKLMRLGPQVFDPGYAASWRTWRLVLIGACVAATVWCVTAGYGFGARTGQWTAGFGGALAVWAVTLGCIALAARTTQNNGVLVGVAATMAGVALFFIQRLGERVGDPELREWRQFQYFDLWAPALIAIGVVVLVASLVVQSRFRSA